MPAPRSRLSFDRPSLTAAALAFGLLLAPLAGEASLREQAEAVMERHCLDCHDAETQKGDVRLDGLEGLALEPRLELLNRLQEQVHLKQMPPEKKKPLPPQERRQVLDWVAGELNPHRASKLEEKLGQPDYGNFVDARGFLAGTGDTKLDGEVTDAFDLIRRLAKSDRVRQSVLRHAFRFFLGRNETLADSKTLIDADRAYLASGGSFDAVILSLLSSDTFLCRKPSPETAHAH